MGLIQIFSSFIHPFLKKHSGDFLLPFISIPLINADPLYPFAKVKAMVTFWAAMPDEPS